jgi:hypothetical protein
MIHDFVYEEYDLRCIFIQTFDGERVAVWVEWVSPVRGLWLRAKDLACDLLEDATVHLLGGHILYLLAYSLGSKCDCFRLVLSVYNPRR